MPNTWKRIAFLAALLMTAATMPAGAQESGFDPRDHFHVSNAYGEAWGAVTWEDNDLAWIDLTVTDTRYDGWCAVVITDPANFGLTIEEEACGVGTSRAGHSNPVAAPMTSLHTITFTICGYYPPHGTWACGETDTLHNPYA